jgi:hypothetical protein
MRIPSGVTNKYLNFIAVDDADLKTRVTGLTGFTVYRARNGGSSTAWTTPTTVEFSSSNQPGEYALLVDEDTTLSAGSDNEEMIISISHASMERVTRVVEIYRRTVTGGETLTVSSGALPWPAAWDAEVQSECADALNAYDPPTKAELDSAVAPLATAANLATVAGYLDTEIAAILEDTGTTLPAQIAGLTTPPTVAAIADEIDTRAFVTQIDDIHKIHGLDLSNPMTVTPTSREAGTIEQTISGDGTTTSTVTRTA